MDYCLREVGVGWIKKRGLKKEEIIGERRGYVLKII